MKGNTPNKRTCEEEIQNSSIKKHNKFAYGRGRCSGSVHITQLRYDFELNVLMLTQVLLFGAFLFIF